jgi:photosystem II stability/assembly factor-like uncharacterized protein
MLALRRPKRVTRRPVVLLATCALLMISTSAVGQVGVPPADGSLAALAFGQAQSAFAPHVAHRHLTQTLWSNTGFPGSRAWAMAVAPTDPPTIYAAVFGTGLFASTDGGLHWADRSAGLTNLNLYALAVDPTAPARLYLATYGGGVHASGDGGVHWRALSAGPIYPVTLALDPQAPATVYAGADAFAYKSTDHGDHWTKLTAGLPASHGVGAIAVDPGDSVIVYAGTWGGGAFKSVDGGASWVPVGAGLTDPWVRALVVDPTETNVVQAGTDATVFTSTDGGASWSTPPGGGPSPPARVLVQHPDDPSAIYGAGWQGAFRSVTDGRSWSRITAGLDGLDVRGLALDPDGGATLYAGTWGGGVLRTPHGLEQAGLLLPYRYPDEAAQLYCFDLFPWAANGEAHGGIDIVALHEGVQPEMTKRAIVAPADCRVEWVLSDSSGAGLTSLMVVLRLNKYWFAIYNFEPQSASPATVAEQQASILVSEGEMLHAGDKVGDLVVWNVASGSYPHVHFALLYKNPADTLEHVAEHYLEVRVSDGTDLAPAFGPGSPWQPRDLSIPTTFFCPYEYSSLAARDQYRRLPSTAANGNSCACPCAYRSAAGDCGACAR